MGLKPLFTLLRSMRIAGLLCGFLAAAGTASAQRHDAGGLIDRVMEAYGGSQKLRSIKAYRLQGTLRAHQRRRDGEFIRISEGFDRLKVLVRYATNMELRVVDGKRGWRGRSRQELGPAHGPMLDAMLLQAARARLPWILDRFRDRVRLVKEEKENSLVLEMPLQSGLLLRAFLDTKSIRIVRTESILPAGAMQMKFTSDYADFRNVSGVFFPFREENYASGVHTASMAVQELIFNPTADQMKLPGGQ